MAIDKTKNTIKLVFSAILLLLIIFIIYYGYSKKIENAHLKTKHSEYRVCMITDAGNITDKSFNQTIYESCRDYCKSNNIDFTYKQPESPTVNAMNGMVDIAVAEGYNIIVMPGYMFAKTIIQRTPKYPDVKFIAIDLNPGDICFAAEGGKYYNNPDAYNAEDYYNIQNTYCANYQEMISGYLAGYTAIQLGYRHLGFLGGQAVPAVIRYGYGYIQGIDAAAKKLGITDNISIEYAYSGQFFGNTEITAAMDTWFSKGTEVVFACGGSIYTSVAAAAARAGGKIIGVDTDQSAIIDEYGEGMTITSALKNMTATVNSTLNSIIFDGTWKYHVGKIDTLGMVSDTDLSLNYVGLPLESTHWNNKFGIQDYKKLVSDIFNKKLLINYDIKTMPEVSVHMKVREGTIK